MPNTRVRLSVFILSCLLCFFYTLSISSIWQNEFFVCAFKFYCWCLVHEWVKKKKKALTCWCHWSKSNSSNPYTALCKLEKVPLLVQNFFFMTVMTPKRTGSIRFVKKQDQVFPDLRSTTRILASLLQHHIHHAHSVQRNWGSNPCTVIVDLWNAKCVRMHWLDQQRDLNET